MIKAAIPNKKYPNWLKNMAWKVHYQNTMLQPFQYCPPLKDGEGINIETYTICLQKQSNRQGRKG